MDCNTYFSRGERTTTAILRACAILWVLTFVIAACSALVSAIFGGGGNPANLREAMEVAGVGGGGWRYFGMSLVNLLLAVVGAAVYFFFIPMLTRLCWSVWPGANPNLRASIHEMTSPPPQPPSA